MANECEMTSEVLEERSIGPLELEVFGSRTLCIEEAGSANLDPFAPTVRIRNTSLGPITINYNLDPLRSFRSKSVWPADRPDKAFEFNDCCGGGGAPSAQEKTIPAGKELLISSWTRHNDEIWGNEVPRGGNLADYVPREYIVWFNLTITYDRGTGPIPVDENFNITLQSVPVVLEDN